MVMNDDVKVEDCVSTDLEQTEEAVFEVICLNPDEPASKIKEKYNLADGRVVEVTDSLVSKGLVEPVTEEGCSDLVWRVTELGRLQLLKWVQVMRFDVMEAKLRGQPRRQVEGLKRKKEAFENAYKQCRVLFGDE